MPSQFMDGPTQSGVRVPSRVIASITLTNVSFDTTMTRKRQPYSLVPTADLTSFEQYQTPLH